MKQILCTFILSFAVLVTSAQTVSNKKMPFVDADRTVTFRYVNKQVKHVTIEGSFPKSMSMVGKDGAWGYRTAPLPSEMYTYRFAIGGKKKVTDPLNPNVVCDIDDSLSYFVVGDTLVLSTWITMFRMVRYSSCGIIRSSIRT